MIPILTRQGKYLSVLTMLTLLGGVIFENLILIILAAIWIAFLLLAYTHFLQVYFCLKSEAITIQLPQNPTPIRLFKSQPLTLSVQNRSPFTLYRVQVRFNQSPALQEINANDSTGYSIPEQTEQRIEHLLVSSKTGIFFIYGVVLEFIDFFGTFGLTRYFRKHIPVKVLPDFISQMKIKASILDQPMITEMKTLTHQTKSEFGMDLREIRDHQYGDPYKNIEWKSSARLNRLMAKEFCQEGSLTHQLLLDISPSMREGKNLPNKLDFAIQFISRYIRYHLDKTDRIGLITYDNRIYGRFNEETGKSHFYILMNHLSELNNIVDEDLTFFKDDELVNIIGDFIAREHGQDFKKNSFDSETEMGYTNDIFYDVDQIERWVSQALKKSSFFHKMYQRGHIKVAKTPLGIKLRLFCRISGIEIPYRVTSRFDLGAQGLVSALSHLYKRKVSHQLILIVSDFEERFNADAILSQVKQLRKMNNRVLMLIPFSPWFSRETTLLPKERAAFERISPLIQADYWDRYQKLREKLKAIQVPVVYMGASDSFVKIYSQISKGIHAIRFKRI